MYTIGKDEILSIITGGCFYGAGGGGPVSMGQMLLDQMGDEPSIQVMEAADLLDDYVVAVSAMLGSPDAASGETGEIKSPSYALQAVSEATGKTLKAVLPAEIGAANSIVPLLSALQMGLPVLDADGAGRAVPTLSNTTMSAGGMTISPLALATEDDQTILITTMNAESAEDLCRGIVGTDAFGSIGGLSAWAATGEDLRPNVIFGGLSLARQMGDAIRNAQLAGSDVVQAVSDELTKQGMQYQILMRGQVREVQEATTGSLDLGQILVSKDGGSALRIFNLNENMYAFLDSAQPVAMSPDLICYLDTDSGDPLSNVEVEERVKDGETVNVAVFAVQANAMMRTEPVINSFLQVFRTMGYGGTFVSPFL